MSGFRVGLLGHGTVGSAFAQLLPARAGRIEQITGLRPSSAACSPARAGTFEQLLDGSELIVELMGGIEPARTWLLTAMRAGRHVVTANKQLLSHHGEELWDVAREQGVQLRFEGAVAGVVPVIRVLQESLAGATIDRVSGIVNGTTNFILTEMGRTGSTSRQRWGRPSGSATPRPTRPTTSPGATPPRRWRSSPGSRSRPRCTSTR